MPGGEQSPRVRDWFCRRIRSASIRFPSYLAIKAAESPSARGRGGPLRVTGCLTSQSLKGPAGLRLISPGHTETTYEVEHTESGAGSETKSESNGPPVDGRDDWGIVGTNLFGAESLKSIKGMLVASRDVDDDSGDNCDNK